MSAKCFDKFTLGNKILFIMKLFSVLLIAAALALPLSLQAAPPSDESINELLELSKAGKLMDSVWAQMDSMMKANLQQVTKGKQLNADEQAILDRQQNKMMALIKGDLSWDKMKDMFIETYRETFTQEDIDGLIAFYKSPAGQSFVNKQPELMKRTMTLMQQRMVPMIQEIQKMTQETAAELKAASVNNATTPAGN
jgi:uncharacterized protein